jgi:dTDP-4-dehydrorhamnose reductase
MVNHKNPNASPFLIIGGNSLLARSIYYFASCRINLILVSRPSSNIVLQDRHVICDYNSVNNLHSLIRQFKPRVLINCAAITSVEYCEQNPTFAYQANVLLPQILASLCLEYGIKFAHISTDHLFDGVLGNYTENSPPKPVNVYGVTKLIAESKILKSNPFSLVLRTNFFSWGPKYRSSFSDQILNNLSLNRDIHLFSDAFFSPVTAYTLFDCITNLVETDLAGVYNISSDDSVSKYEFGLLLARQFGFNTSLVRRSRLSERSDLVQRPLNLSLLNSKVSTFLPFSIGSIEKQVFNLYSNQSLKYLV